MQLQCAHFGLSQFSQWLRCSSGAPCGNSPFGVCSSFSLSFCCNKCLIRFASCFLLSWEGSLPSLLSSFLLTPWLPHNTTFEEVGASSSHDNMCVLCSLHPRSTDFVDLSDMRQAVRFVWHATGGKKRYMIIMFEVWRYNVLMVVLLAPQQHYHKTWQLVIRVRSLNTKCSSTRYVSNTKHFI